LSQIFPLPKKYVRLRAGKQLFFLQKKNKKTPTLHIFVQLPIILAALPSTQTMVERAFSSAWWQASDHENLGSENQAQQG